MEYLARVRKNKKDEIEDFQSVLQHAEGVSEFLIKFSSAFCRPEWAKTVAYWHDFGKLDKGWQAYFKDKVGYDEDRPVEDEAARGNHSTLGAAMSISKLGKLFGKLFAYPIAGHHAGLPDCSKCNVGTGRSLYERIFDQDGNLRAELIEGITKAENVDGFKLELPKTMPWGDVKFKDEHIHLWIRMLFSCLVDADWLDTERFMDHQKFLMRGAYPPLEKLKEKFDSFMEEKIKESRPSHLNLKRKEILETCREKAKLPPGFFSLTVPTGGGKTFSAMAFALEHALRHKKERVIMAIPYTSIIEQTADEYGKVFGIENVIEHHSNIEPEEETELKKLASENWDAPIIVTTNVQLFESLHASKTKLSRKLHNIANSVIILDEAQMLSPEFLQPILSTLKGLVEHFGVTVVLCTATQPALLGRIGAPPLDFNGIEKCIEIIEDAEKLSKEFKRVTIHAPKSINEKMEWEELGEELKKHEQVLCIVNTRKDCRYLHKIMPEGTFHLSALMCGEERSDIIADIKEKLKSEKKRQLRVISTQIVEAGVDIDFPIVYRAFAGLDSLAQAAGRCNREASTETGHFHIFNPPNLPKIGLMLKGAQAAQSVIGEGFEDFDPILYEKYFRIFYSRVNDTDKSEFTTLMKDSAQNFEFQFRSFAQNFRLINEEGQKSVIVRYKGKNNDSNILIDRLKTEGPHRELMRKLQRFTVNIYDYHFKKLLENGGISNPSDYKGYFVLTPGAYKEGRGVVGEDENIWHEDTHIQ